MRSSVGKVLLVHNNYKQASGEDVVLANEQALLARHGHDIRLATVSIDTIEGLWGKLRVAWHLSYAISAREWLTREIVATAPDVVHVHNFFSQLTPSIYDACRNTGLPVIQTLHNYRTICSAGFLMRGGRPCEDCVGGPSYPAVVHRCYRKSLLGSLAVARMIEVHQRKGTWRNKVNRFIALTEFAKSKFVAAGLPAKKIYVNSNFVEDR